ncbi:hypothetical protein [Cyclobacterium xiamenense]|nr:hypothetical protein [Cyclobacterium xiamenense]
MANHPKKTNQESLLPVITEVTETAISGVRAEEQREIEIFWVKKGITV